MYLIYNILAIIIFVLALPVFAVRLIREEGFGERLKQSLGTLPAVTLDKVAGKNAIWLHAASVGEIVAASPIVKEIRRELPGIPIVVSVVTAGGYAMANRIIPEADGIIFFPLDLPYLSHSVVSKIKPRVFLLVETELWPNFLKSARDFNIPVMMVNGRISDKSLNRYSYLKGVLKDMLDTVNKFCMQSAIDAEYIIKLGADPNRVVVTGNTKFDQNYTQLKPSDKTALQKDLGLEKSHPIIVAGSTHTGEEEVLFSAFIQVASQYPNAKLLIAPREVMRTGEIIDLAAKHGLAAVRRTSLPSAEKQDNVNIIVIDTIGELGKMYGLGDIVFVGGSIVSKGGHNILEPAAHGKPILVGPNMFNFKDTYALFSGREACATVTDSTSMAEIMCNLLDNPKVAEDKGRAALAIIEENQGASRKSAIYLKELLGIKSNSEILP